MLRTEPSYDGWFVQRSFLVGDETESTFCTINPIYLKFGRADIFILARLLTTSFAQQTTMSIDLAHSL
jgi:hypothetical protein